MTEPATAQSTTHFDVLIVGAGVSGVGAACHLRRECPDKSFVILEGREHFGGTWDLFKFPGIRSDSDLYTYGYCFRPWQGKPIATAEEIKAYMAETMAEYSIDETILYGHCVDGVEWSSSEKVWVVAATEKASGASKTFTCGFLWMNQGYFDYEAGYQPEFPGVEDFEGTFVHPQHWPEDLDYAGKKMVVIGLGATTVTIIPAVAETVEHVTMLQRSPSYIFSAENRSPIADLLEGLDLDEDLVHEIIRRRNLKDGEQIAWMAREQPEALRKELMDAVRAALPEGYDIDKHFSPRYMPWEERLCLIPDGDLFKAISSGNASVVTDHVKTFTKHGILLESGGELEADIIVSATGLTLCPMGNIPFAVDGEAVDFSSTWTYKGIMYSDLPNLAWTFGYIRTSWTMRSDLIADFVCRLLKAMDEKGAASVTPRLRTEDHNMQPKMFIDEDDFSPGYMRRTMDLMPKQGDHEPWTNCQDYYVECKTIPGCELDDGVLIYESHGQDRKTA